MINAVRGMHSMYSEEAELFNWLCKKATSVAKRYNFNSLHLPVVEHADLYTRNLGSESDIVSKEIYAFTDKGDNRLALRPEFTAGAVRFFVENFFYNTAMPQKFFSYGSLFRYDRPQKGRYRQFNQFNFEIFGAENLEYEILSIIIVNTFLNEIGIKLGAKWVLEINFLADEETRKQYTEDLVKYLSDAGSKLSEDSQNKLKSNPLRILDSKNRKDKDVLKDAETIDNYYSDEYKSDTDKIKSILDSIGIPYKVNPNLVRGMDYYDGLVFEVYKADQESAQGSIIGGGKYSRLVKEISDGKFDISAIGFASGIERLMSTEEVQNCFQHDQKQSTSLRISIIPETDQEDTLSAFQVLQMCSKIQKVQGIPIVAELILAGNSITKRIRKAGQNGSNIVIICNQQGERNETIMLKNLRNREDDNDEVRNNSNALKEYLASTMAES